MDVFTVNEKGDIIKDPRSAIEDYFTGTATDGTSHSENALKMWDGYASSAVDASTPFEAHWARLSTHRGVTILQLFSAAPMHYRDEQEIRGLIYAAKGDTYKAWSFTFTLPDDADILGLDSSSAVAEVCHNMWPKWSRAGRNSHVALVKKMKPGVGRRAYQ